ncbi:MAG: hypothetical protein GMKNLPBB_00726 [Myxococcota bacterium]|nr:hypothetical protein [Myxococcota bacterium]
MRKNLLLPVCFGIFIAAIQSCSGCRETGGAPRALREASTQPVAAVKEIRALAAADWGAAVGGSDGVVAGVPANGSAPFELRGHAAPVTRLCFAANGERLVSLDQSGAAKVWNITSKSWLRDLAQKAPAVTAMASEDGWAAAGAATGDITLWRPGPGGAPERIEGLSAGSAVRALAFSPRAKLLAAGTEDGALRILDVESGSWRPSAAASGPAIAAVRFVETNGVTRLVAVRRNGEFAWAAPDATDFPWRSSGLDKLSAAAIGGRGEIAVARDSDLRVFFPSAKNSGDWEPWTLPAAIPHAAGISALHVSGDGKTVLTGGRDGLVGVWDSRGDEVKIVFRDHGNVVSALAMDPQGKVIASASADGQMIFWRLKGELLILKAKAAGPLAALTFAAPDRVISGGASGEIAAWDVSLTLPELYMRRYVPSDYQYACASGGQIIAAGDGSRNVWLWDKDNNRIRVMLKGLTGAVTAMALNQAGTKLALATGDGKLWTFNPGDGQQLREAPLVTLSQHALSSALIHRLAAAGDWVIAAGPRHVWVWNSAASSVNVVESPGAAGGPVDVAVSGDSSAAILHDRHVRLLDPAKPPQIQTIVLPRSGASRIALAPGGGFVVGFGDGAVERYNAKGMAAGGCKGLTGPVLRLAVSATAIAASTAGDEMRWPVTCGAGKLAQAPSDMAAACRYQNGHLVETSPALLDSLRTEEPQLFELVEPRRREFTAAAAGSSGMGGQMVLVASAAGEVSVRDAAAGRVINAWPHSSPRTAALSVPRAPIFVVGSEDGALQVLDASTGKDRVFTQTGRGGVRAMAAGPDQFAVLYEKGVALRAFATLAETAWAPLEGVNAISVAAGKDMVWVGDDKGAIHPIGVNGEKSRPVQAGNAPIRALAAGKDGVLWAGDNAGFLWRIPASGAPEKFPLDSTAVTGLQLVWNDQWLIALTSSGKLLAWDIAQSVIRFEKTGLGGHSDVLAVSADNAWVINAGQTGAQVWRLSRGEFLASLKESAPIFAGLACHPAQPVAWVVTSRDELWEYQLDSGQAGVNKSFSGAILRRNKEEEEAAWSVSINGAVIPVDRDSMSGIGERKQTRMRAGMGDVITTIHQKGDSWVWSHPALPEEGLKVFPAGARLLAYDCGGKDACTAVATDRVVWLKAAPQASSVTRPLPRPAILARIHGDRLFAAGAPNIVTVYPLQAD